jgi:hypothetical protein
MMVSAPRLQSQSLGTAFPRPKNWASLLRPARVAAPSPMVGLPSPTNILGHHAGTAKECHMRT